MDNATIEEIAGLLHRGALSLLAMHDVEPLTGKKLAARIRADVVIALKEYEKERARGQAKAT